MASAVLARWNKWSVLDRTGLVIVKLCTACDVARMGTLSASNKYDVLTLHLYFFLAPED